MSTRDLHALLCGLEPRRRPGVHVFVTVPEDSDLLAAAVASVREDEGLSLVLPAELAAERGLRSDFAAAWITLGVASPLDGVGLTAVVANALRRAGIACNVVAGHRHDHLFVPVDRADEALERLRALARRARAAQK